MREENKVTGPKSEQQARMHAKRLAALEEIKKGVESVQDLANRMDISSTTAYGYLNWLEKTGLCTVWRDGRRCVIQATKP